jgi:hypothetical protein
MYEMNEPLPGIFREGFVFVHAKEQFDHEY